MNQIDLDAGAPPPMEPGEIRNGVQIVPDTVPDVMPAYFRKLRIGWGQIRGKLRQLDDDLRSTIVAHKGRAPTLGELLVIGTILRCELEILLSENWCKKNQKDLTGCIAMVERQRKASVERDRHFEKLGLDGQQMRASLAIALYGDGQ